MLSNDLRKIAKRISSEQGKFLLNLFDPGMDTKTLWFPCDAEDQEDQEKVFKKVEKAIRDNTSNYTSAIVTLIIPGEKKIPIATYKQPESQLGLGNWIRDTRKMNIHPLYYKSTFPTA